MFDTPDLGPLCYAPVVSIFIGAIIYYISYKISSRFTDKYIKQRNIGFTFALLIMPIICISSVALGIGAMSPAPWFEPKTRNVVGAWVLRMPTEKYLTVFYQVEVIPHELVFLDDGTFYMENIPAFWDVDYHSAGTDVVYMNGHGKWEFERLQGIEGMERIIRAKFVEINGKPDEREMRYYFEKHLPPYILVTLDSDDIIFRFKRKNALDINFRDLLLY